LLARILEAASRTKKREDQLKQTNKQKNAIFARELHSALKLTVGFLKIYY
jgi:hypothetical protein